MIEDKINIEIELFERYNELILEKEIGLVVFSIYSQYNLREIDKLFSYKTIINIIDKVWKKLGNKEIKRGETQKYEELILILRKHYIEKDTKTNNYSLTDYAIKICNIINDEIENILKPSEIEQLFNNLLLILKDNIISFEKFFVWYNKEFQPRKFDINAQVRTLRHQAEKAQNELNIIISKDDDYFDMLKATENQIDTIQEQNHKIIKSFSAKESIKELLDNSELSESREFRDIRSEIRDFFREIDKKLMLVSEIIDTTKPKIYKLYQDIEKKRYDKKLEKLLLFVLQNSSSDFLLEKNKSFYEINIQLPTELDFEKLILPQPSKFLKVEYVEFTEPDTIETQDAEYDHNENTLQIEKRKQQIEKNRKIEIWFNRILNDLQALEINNSIIFTNYFFKILEQENQDLELAIKIANKVFSDFSKNHNFSVEIDKTLEINTSINDIALWKMTITKLSY